MNLLTPFISSCKLVLYIVSLHTVTPRRISMRTYNKYKHWLQNKLLPFLFLLILFSFSIFVSAQKNSPTTETSSPPLPPPLHESSSGSASTLSSATLKKIKTLKSVFGERLSAISLNSNRENDFLVKVMQLNYSAIGNVADAALGSTATNKELTKQSNLFLEANALLPPNNKDDFAGGIGNSKNVIQKRRLSDIKDELVRISEEYKRSGMDAAVLSFATKIIRDTAKVPD